VIPSKEQSREKRAVMGRLEAREPSLFYDFCLEDHVPHDHLLRQIAKVIDLKLMGFSPPALSAACA
jgi:hypothetical protein